MSIIPPPKSKFLQKVTKQQMAENLENLSTVDKLFRRKFAMYVPAAFMYTAEDFARGVPVTTDKDKDSRAANEMILTYLPIAPDNDNPGFNILEFYENEVPCSFRYDQDVTAVYGILTEHFREMANYINNEPLMNKEKRQRIMDDLSRFDKLASMIHPTAHALMPKHLVHSSVEERLRQVLQPQMGKIAITDNLPAAETVPEYVDYRAGISKHLLKRSKQW